MEAVVGRIKAELSLADVGASTQVVPLVEYCQRPSVVALAVLPTIARPPSAVAVEPPLTVSVTSEYWLAVINALTNAPAGLAVSSLIAASVADPEASGASLTAVMLVPSVTALAALEYAVVPPVAASDRLGPAPVLTAPDESSIRRTVSCPGVPFQLAFGRNLTWSVDLSRNGAASVGAVGRSVQPLPLSYCHLPWEAVAALATTAIPASAFAVEPPLWVSVASLKIGPKIEFTVAPAGLPVSSGTLAKVTLAAVRNGASLTGVMLITTFFVSLFAPPTPVLP